jgi:competence protein ComEA
MKPNPLKNNLNLKVPLTTAEKKVLGFMVFLSLLGLAAVALRTLWEPKTDSLWVQPALKENAQRSRMRGYPEFIPKSQPALASVDINQAKEKELTKVPGVGLVLARRIVEYRKEKGDFQNLSQLHGVPGIGEKRFRQISPYFAVSPGSLTRK